MLDWVDGGDMALLVLTLMLLTAVYLDLRPIKKRDKRLQKIIDDCGCVCKCPNCGDYLNDQAECEDEELVKYTCSKCKEVSYWSFDIAPVPILMNDHMGPTCVTTLKDKEMK